MLIPNYLCDRNDTLAMWGMARLFQEVAGEDVSAGGIGFCDLLAQGKAWVLSRMYYHVDCLPREGEDVTATTWSRGTDGLFAFREFLLTEGGGRVCAAASSYWAVMDINTRHVVRLHGLMDAFHHDPRCATNQPVIERLRMPNGVGEEVASFPMRPSMIDHTGHVNNAEYVKWIFDLLPTTIEMPSSFDFYIEYMLETHPDECVVISRVYDNNNYMFQVVNPRATAVRARLSF